MRHRYLLSLYRKNGVTQCFLRPGHLLQFAPICTGFPLILQENDCQLPLCKQHCVTHKFLKLIFLGLSSFYIIRFLSSVVYVLTSSMNEFLGRVECKSRPAGSDSVRVARVNLLASSHVQITPISNAESMILGVLV